MNYTFKSHKLKPEEILWLVEVYNNFHNFDPRIAKVKLWDQLPNDFDPKKIDSRFLSDGKNISLLGIWVIDPKSTIIAAIESVILQIKKLILNNPGIEKIKANDIAETTNQNLENVEIAFYNLDSIGNFFSKAIGSKNSNGYSEIVLSNDDSYDAYLKFNSIDDLLESLYLKPDYSNIIYSNFYDGSSYIATPKIAINSGIQPKVIDTKKNTAFVLMAMSPEIPELEDIYQAIKSVCYNFGINAYRADEIEHQDKITDLILKEIETCEYLIADLSYERPNVYYEIGYSHAKEKRPILYRKRGTNLHFDLSVHNVPEYKNTTELRELLTKRFEAILGRTSL